MMPAMPAPARRFGALKMAVAMIFAFSVAVASGSQLQAPSTSPVPRTMTPCAPAPASGRAVSVKDRRFRAKGDGRADDTSAIQRAIDAVAGSGGTVIIPKGIYMVDPVANSQAGIRLKSNMSIRFEAGAVLQALPTATSNYVVLMVSGVQNVNILGGLIRGNRHKNAIVDTREGGDGVHVSRSRQVVIQDLTSMDCWEDGFYIGEMAQDVTLCNVTADGNRRNGLSITSVDGLLVKDSTFKNTTGFMEKGEFVCGNGVDIEPNPGQTVSNVRFLGCTFNSNATEGLAVGPSVANRGKAFVTGVQIESNAVLGNGLRRGSPGLTISNTRGHKIINNKIEDNHGIGICLRNEANDNLVMGNTVTRTKAAASSGNIGYGILLYQSGGNKVQGNTVTENAACGVKNASPSGANAIGPNFLRNNHPDTCL
jgi:parallel beta-helix repeat protein